jgi:signal transduction histidine kinase
MNRPLKVLILEDVEADAELMVHELKNADFLPDWIRVDTENSYLTALASGPDLILSDYNLPQFDAFLALQLMQEQRLDIPFIVISGAITEDVAVEFMKRGASDYLLKDRLARLGQAVVRALEQRELREEKRRTDATLFKKSEDLARSNAELAQFAYVANHDLQEPLRMVTSYVQLLEKRYKGKLDPDADEFIGYIVEGTKRMKLLLAALLDCSRLDTGGHPLQMVECEKVLENALQNLRMVLDETKGNVTHNPLPAIMADETQMVQLFQNLIGNGLKFHGPQPPLIHISAKQEGTNWIFSFQDNGIGIDPQYFEKIFVIFQRLHGRDKYPGTGIGLTIAKKIVERHGGQIWVESVKESGTAFYFTVPCNT